MRSPEGGGTPRPNSRVLGGWLNWETGARSLAQERGGAGTRTLPGYRMRLIIPGMTMRNMGVSFRYPHRMQPALMWVRLFPARQRCTMTYGRGVQLPTCGPLLGPAPHPGSNMCPASGW